MSGVSDVGAGYFAPNLAGHKDVFILQVTVYMQSANDSGHNANVFLPVCVTDFISQVIHKVLQNTYTILGNS
jgi:hypothetical protein